jgi:(S)-ureidoglycine aminohydrolase
MKLVLLFIATIIALPVSAQLKPIHSNVFHWDSLPIKKDSLKREVRRIATGTTNEFDFFELYTNTVNKKGFLKPPHIKNGLEELVIVKSGTMKCMVGNKTELLGPGSVALIPPLEKQNIENAGDTALTYYVLLFHSKKGMDIERSKQAGGALLLHKDSMPYTETATKGTRKYFDRPTAMCENYEMHTTHLFNKGTSHQPHQHVDTEIILMIDGETEMVIDGISYKAGPGDLYIIESGKMHGISNASDKPCSYFAFKWR